MQSLSFLYQQLTTFKIEEDEDLTMGFNNLHTITTKMKMPGKPMSDLMLVQIMMCALLPSYAIVSTVIQTSNQHGSISSDTVIKAALAKEERRKKGVGLTTMFMHALKAKAPKAKADPKGKKKDCGPPCQNCAKPGHMKDNCWAKGAGAEGNGPHQKCHTTKQTKKDDPKSELAKLAVSGDGSESVPTLCALPTIDRKAAANTWLLDSGASQHMRPNHHWFSSYQPLARPIQIRVGDGNTIPTVGIGHVLAILQNRWGTETEAMIKSVLHVPKLNASLLSVRELVEGGTSVVFQKGTGAVLITRNGDGPEIGYAKESGQLYRLDVRIAHTEATAYTGFVEPDSQNDCSDNEAQEFAAYTVSPVVHADLTTWHRRLSHISYKYVLDMVRNGVVRGMDIVGSCSPPKTHCRPCLKGKQTRAPFLPSTNHASKVLELLHSDLHGPAAVQAIRGIRYFVVMIDDKSRKLFIDLLRHKDEYPVRFKEL
jgi:hypothetical protein